MGPSAVSLLLVCRAVPRSLRVQQVTIGHPVRRGTSCCSPTLAKTRRVISNQGRHPQLPRPHPPPHSSRAVIQSRAAPHRISTGLERLKILIHNLAAPAPHCTAPCRSLPLWARGEVFDTPPEDGRLAIRCASLMTAVTTQFGQRHHTAHPPAPLWLSRSQTPDSLLFSTSPSPSSDPAHPYRASIINC